MKTMKLTAMLLLVLSLVGTAFGLPDLFIRETNLVNSGGIWYRAGCPGQTFQAKVTVGNYVGTTPSGSFSVLVELRRTEGQGDYPMASVLFSEGVPAGAEVEKEWNTYIFPTDIPGGRYLIWWRVDPYDAIDESNEGNNDHQECWVENVTGALVPDVVGSTKEAAEAQIPFDGCTLGRTWYGSSDTVPAGLVMSQKPPGGQIWDPTCVTVEPSGCRWTSPASLALWTSQPRRTPAWPIPRRTQLSWIWVRMSEARRGLERFRRQCELMDSVDR